MDWEDVERLEQLEKQLEQRLGRSGLEQRLGRSGRRYLQQNHRRHWLGGHLYAIWYVLLAVAAATTIYHFLAS